MPDPSDPAWAVPTTSHVPLPPAPRADTQSHASDATSGAGPPPKGDPTEPNPFPFLGPPLRPGDLGRLGPYRVARLIGEGGMGFVFRGEDDALNRPVALKVMRPEIAARPEARERFLREGRSAAAVKSDNVAGIYFVGESNGVPFLALEYLAGWPLDQWLAARGGKAPVPAAVRIAKDALRGLAAAHERGVIHRDLKPANLWVERPSGKVKLLDFGLARAADGGDQLTADGAVVGTPAYMAPEQAAGGKVDARADLFGVGAVVYRALAGVGPFSRGCRR